jgi:prepilin-type N-terminal cleavage/methylation domain-containing protein
MNRSFIRLPQERRAFTLLEVLASMVMIGIIGSIIFFAQNSSWRKTSKSNGTLIAGHLIERQIEKMRMDIEKDTTTFPPLSGTISENGITLRWQILAAYRPTPDHSVIANVRECSFTASWGSSKEDTLKVSTYLSKKF